MTFSSARPPVGLFDEDHQMMIGILGELDDAISSGRSRSIVRSILERLLACTTEHFSHEEEVMQKRRYPRFLQHARRHHLFVDDLARLISDCDTGGVLVNADMVRHLTQWARDHLCDEDEQLFSFLSDHAPKGSASGRYEQVPGARAIR